MAKHKGRDTDHRQTLDRTGDWQSDEFIFGITRGACAPARRKPGCGGRRSFEAGKAFEEIYPRYPFSELVRLSIRLGKWLARTSRRSHDPTGNQSRHFFDPASSSRGSR